MNDPKRLWAWVGAVVVVVIIAAWAWVHWHASSKPPAAPQPVFAPQGQLTPQFPKGLILDSNAAITGSYSINYSTSTNQYTASFNSSSTVTSLYNTYESYFKSNGWTVTGSLNTHPNFDAIAATQGTGQAQVVITLPAGNKGSQVTVTYVQQ